MLLIAGAILGNGNLLRWQIQCIGLAIGVALVLLGWDWFGRGEFPIGKRIILIAVGSAATVIYVRSCSPAPLVSINFKHSSELSWSRRENISDQFNEAYRYLKSLGIDGPINLPMVGVDPENNGLRENLWPNEPLYHSEILLPAGKLDDDFWVRRTYIIFTLRRILRLEVTDLVSDEPMSDSAIRHMALYMASDYLTSSSFGRLTNPQGIPLSDWVRGIWNVREKCGQDLADPAMAYMIMDWSKPDAGLRQGPFDLNAYLYRRFGSGVSAKDNAGEHLKCWDSALKEYVKIEGEP
jgi:hypothetical protein